MRPDACSGHSQGGIPRMSPGDRGTSLQRHDSGKGEGGGHGHSDGAAQGLRGQNRILRPAKSDRRRWYRLGWRQGEWLWRVCRIVYNGKLSV